MADDKKGITLNYASARKRRRKYFNLSPADAELAGCIVGCMSGIFAFGSIILLFVVTLNIAFKLMQRLVISMAYGADRYAAGLRLVKKFRLSDGSTLSGGYQALYMVGVFVCLVLVLAPYVRLLQKLGLLREGDEDAAKHP